MAGDKLGSLKIKKQVFIQPRRVEMFWEKRLRKMSYKAIRREMYWSFSRKRTQKLLSFAIEKIGSFDEGYSLYENYGKRFDHYQKDKFENVIQGYLHKNYRLRQDLFQVSGKDSWLRVTPPDDLSFCMLMVKTLESNSIFANKAYEKAKELVFSNEKIGFWDLYELYSVRKNKALWKRVWKELNREDNLWLGGIEKVLKQTGKKDVLNLWISKKADNINTWNTILRACPKRLRKLACKELAAYYLKLADDPEIYKRESL